jgi:competence protein CoiA
MLYAILDGAKTTASPHKTGACPGCRGSVIAKCGEIKCWHWAHAVSECDPWHEGETQWHLDWKKLFPKQSVEIILGEHRADVLLNETVIEFQNSPITPAEINERELFYGRMIWVFNAQRWHIKLRRNLRPEAENSTSSHYWERKVIGQGPFADVQMWPTEEALDPGPYRTFRWKWPHRSLLKCSAPVCFDIGQDNLLQVKKIHWTSYVGGWGYLLSKTQFLRSLGLHFPALINA